MLDTPLKKILKTTAKHLSLIQNLGLSKVQDLLEYFPRGYSDASEIKSLAQIQLNELATFEGILSNFFSRKTKTGKFLTRAIFSDETGSIEIMWFNQPHITQLLPAGKRILLTGKPKKTMRRITLMNPVGELKTSSPIHTARIVPVYHETKGITSKWLRSKIKPILETYKNILEEYLPEEIKRENNLINYTDAVCEVHFPSSEELLEKAKKRLAFDELFLLQLKALQKKWKWQQISREEEKKISISKKEVEKFLQLLRFELTEAQKKVLNEIFEDIQKPYPMSRLLQGDVGSGKTIIAAAACYVTIKAGYQTALMAPTEILAKQHYKSISKVLSPHGINVQILAGSTNEREKKEIHKSIETGTLDCIIGTHALIQEKVHFKNLGLAVIDEQHRFGVKQRDILKSNGSPGLLNLSATPIPRTLAMTIYGDQDISIIDELPPGRKPIITRLVPEEKRMDAYNWMKKQVKEGRQVFVICPLIDDTQGAEPSAQNEIQLKAVIQEYNYLKSNIFPELKLGFLHGKLKQKEKDEIMEKFSKNEMNILVSTSVIEVGIDIPNASIMVIEGAERFGLSQLHQFRGRVGRGVHQSYCFLFTNKETPEAAKRLMAMVQYESGFKLAEIDLEIRGPGEIYGARQSGIPDLKMANFGDSGTILFARNAAQKIINEDPLLTKYSKLKQKIEEAKEIYIKD